MISRIELILVGSIMVISLIARVGLHFGWVN